MSGNSRKNGLLPQPLLLARYVNSDAKEYGPVYTIPNQIVFIKSKTAIIQEPGNIVAKIPSTTKFLPFMSNDKGHLSRLKKDLSKGIALGHSQYLKEQDAKVEVFVPPLDALSFMLAAHGENWIEETQKFLQKTFQPKWFKWKKYSFDLVRKPLADTETDKLSDNALKEQERIYRDWYQLQKSNGIKYVQGLYFNRTRAAIIAFSNSLFDRAAVRVWPHGGSRHDALDTFVRKHGSIEIYAAIIYGTKDELPVGLYNISVTPRSVPNQENWSPKFKEPQGITYTLKEKFRFDFKNLAGEFELINGDPITLEESIIAQFPLQFEHLVKHATETMDDHVKPKAETAPKQITGLDYYAHKITVNKKRMELMTGVLGADNFSSKGWAIASMVVQGLPGGLAKETSDLIFNYKGYKDARETLKNMKRLKELDIVRNSQGLTQIENLERDRLLGRSPWVNEAGNRTFANTWVSKLKIPEEFLKRLNKVAGPVGRLLDAHAFATSYTHWMNTSEVLEDNQKYMDDMMADYHLQIHEDIVDDASPAAKSKNSAVNTKAVSHYDTAGELVAQDLSWLESATQTSYLVHFDVDKWDIKPQDYAELDKVLAVINANSEAVAVVEGHTDTSYTEKYNMALSLRRASAVKNYLVSKGVAPDRLPVVAVGETQPMMNGAIEDKKKSRRVVILLDKKIRKITYAPCREAMFSLEKMRLKTISDHVQWWKDMWVTMDKATDLASGVLLVTPVPGARIAGAAIAVVKVGYVFFKSAALWLDKVIMRNALQTFFNRWQTKSSMICSSEVNQKAMLRTINKKQSEIIPNTVTTIDENDSEAARTLQLQYRLRAEALYGLLLLFVRAASTADKTENYLAKLEKYKVKSYIENFLLNDDWHFSVKRVISLSMDQYWLYAINKQGYQNSEPYQGFGLDSKGNFDKIVKSGETEKLNTLDKVEYYTSVHGAETVYSWFSNPHAIKANFTKIFPIHLLGGKDYEDLAKNFDLVCRELSNNKIYAYTGVYWRPRGYFKKSDWRPIEEKLRKGEAIRPMDQVRVVVVLKKKDESSNTDLDKHYPIKIQLSRTDGYDINGPVYKSVTTKLSETELLESEKNYVGHFGAVFYPFYQFGMNTIYGTKPMSSKTAMGALEADTYHYFYGLTNMRYMFEVTVGKSYLDNNRKNKTTRAIRTAGQKDHYFYPEHFGDTMYESYDSFAYQFHVTLDDKKPYLIPDLSKFKNTDPDSKESYDLVNHSNMVHVADEHVLLNNSFLKRRCKDNEYPNLFIDKFWAMDGPTLSIFMRFGGQGEYFMAHPAFLDIINSSHNSKYDLKLDGNILYVNEFDWRSKVEFIVVVSALNLDKTAYNNMHIDWRRIPLYAELINYTGAINTDGPAINTTLNYIGDISRKEYIGGRNPKHKYSTKEVSDYLKNKLHPGFKPFQEQLEKLNMEHHWAFCNFFTSQIYQKRHIYAAYYNCAYESPTGEKIESIRPFGAYLPGTLSTDQLFDFVSDGLGHRVGHNGNSTQSHNPNLAVPFRYSITNFKSLGDSGIGTSADHIDTEICIAEPYSYIENVPWVSTDYYDKVSAKDKEKLMNPVLKDWQQNAANNKEEKIKRIRKWIERNPKMLIQPNPTVLS